ncbi:Ras-related protein Rab-23 [Elysia marginata]|uniref:Ras-related protein Rab-23 n=1 Tax=Elysia marginata TaxID=1093978 RepID=A0AAV4JRL8_9GAST|nr:Ras-related protein Rab-23 [Elysia marginata]
MPHQQNLSSSSLTASNTSLNGSDEEDYDSLSEDEGLHRSYIVSQPPLRTPAHVRKTNKCHKRSLFRRLLHFGKKQEEDSRNWQTDNSKLDSSTDCEGQSIKITDTSVSNPNVCESNGTKAEDGRLNGVKSQSEPEQPGLRSKNGNIRDTAGHNQQRVREMSAESSSFCDNSQKTIKSSLVGSRLYANRGGEEFFGKRKVKVILLGDPGVGKSTFLQTLVTGKFVPSDKISNILSAQTNLVLTHAGQEVELEIQDTAGQERFRSLTASYYRHAHACFVFFNVNDKNSFASVSTWWVPATLWRVRLMKLKKIYIKESYGVNQESSEIFFIVSESRTYFDNHY